MNNHDFKIFKNSYQMFLARWLGAHAAGRAINLRFQAEAPRPPSAFNPEYEKFQDFTIRFDILGAGLTRSVVAQFRLSASEFVIRHSKKHNMGEIKTSEFIEDIPYGGTQRVHHSFVIGTRK